MPGFTGEWLITQQTELDALLGLVQRNTAALEWFEQTQRRLAELLEKLGQQVDRQAA